MSGHIRVRHNALGDLNIEWHVAEDEAGYYSIRECWVGGVLLGRVACAPETDYSDSKSLWRAYRLVGPEGVLVRSPQQEAGSPMGIRVGGFGKANPWRGGQRTRGWFRDEDGAKLALVRSLFHYFRKGIVELGGEGGGAAELYRCKFCKTDTNSKGRTFCGSESVASHERHCKLNTVPYSGPAPKVKRVKACYHEFVGGFTEIKGVTTKVPRKCMKCGEEEGSSIPFQDEPVLLVGNNEEPA